MKESLVPHETTVLEKKPVKCKIGLNSFEGKHNIWDSVFKWPPFVSKKMGTAAHTLPYKLWHRRITLHDDIH